MPGKVLVGLVACQPGGADDGLETSSEGSTPTEGSTTSPADTTEGAPTDASSTSQGDSESTTGTGPFCGDDVVSGIEECDGTDLRGGTCESLGFSGGTLACDSDCSYDDSDCLGLPSFPTLMLGFSAVKQFEFSWAVVPNADYYRLEESIAPGEAFVQLGEDIVGESVSHTMPLHFRHEASYRLHACNEAGCTGSAEVGVMSSMAGAVGYVKASNTGQGDQFGLQTVLSADGRTLAVGAQEDSNATGIDGDQANDSAENAGAVYVFTRDDAGTWSQQAYVKASNTDAGDHFGGSLALSADGNTLAVGARGERSNATGIDGDEANDSSAWAGAAYVFERNGMGQWSQQAYVKASNTASERYFGSSVALAGDGNTLAVGATSDASSATGIDGDQTDVSAPGAGAVHVFVRDGVGAWAQQAYVKASNTDAVDHFGGDVVLSGDGDTLVVTADGEDSNATGIDGDQANEAADNSGAAYVFVRDGMGAWSQQAYVKASNPDAGDYFGWDLALSEDGDTFAVGALWESSNATGIDGDQANELAYSSGAAYVSVRDDMEQWSQQAYVKASNTQMDDFFGYSVALSGDGNILAVGARNEGSGAVGIGGDRADDSVGSAGAVYVFVRDEMSAWSQQEYVKASNTSAGTYFGARVALSGNGDTLAAGAYFERSNATGVDGNQADDSVSYAGAVYLY